jgi:transcriptional regulator with XRE-family HTH domain
MRTKDKGINERLRELVRIYGDDAPAVFASKIGLAQSTFHNYYQGRDPSLGTLTMIANTFGINLHWLLTGRGEMTLAKQGEVVKETAGSYEVRTIGRDQRQEPGPMALGRAVEVLTRIIQTGPMPLRMAISSELFYIDRLLDEHEHIQATANGAQTDAHRQLEERIQALEERLRKERQKAKDAVGQLKQSGGM